MWAVLVLSGCSTKKNTPGTRFWHAFNARFNTYFNGEQAYLEGNLTKEQGAEDDYTQMLSFFWPATDRPHAWARKATKPPLPNARKPFSCTPSSANPHVTTAAA